MKTTLNVDIDGPFLQPGRPSSEFEAAIDDALVTAGEELRSEIERRLKNVLVNPTGRYQRAISVHVRADSLMEITDTGIVYGPWLEGTDSRNRTSRFKGYATFRKSRDAFEDRATKIAEGELERAVGRLS